MILVLVHFIWVLVNLLFKLDLVVSDSLDRESLSVTLDNVVKSTIMFIK